MSENVRKFTIQKISQKFVVVIINFFYIRMYVYSTTAIWAQTRKYIMWIKLCYFLFQNVNWYIICLLSIFAGSFKRSDMMSRLYLWHKKNLWKEISKHIYSNYIRMIIIANLWWFIIKVELQVSLYMFFANDPFCRFVSHELIQFLNENSIPFSQHSDALIRNHIILCWWCLFMEVDWK